MKTPPRIAASLGATLALVLALTTAGGGASAGAPRGEDSAFFVLAAVAHDGGGPIKDAPTSDNRGKPKREHPLRLAAGGAPGKPGGGGAGDGALQTSATTALGTVAGLNFDGVGVGITPTYADCCAPPDTNLAVGTTQVVQWVNLDFAAFDKATGALLAGFPKPGNSIWAGFANAAKCDVNNDGDPIVQFDKQAGRWFMTQFSVTGGPPFFQCIAVSTSADFVTTTWNRYAFNFGSNFPDYPKVGVWPDAYYISMNLFFNGVTFNGAAACAFDRAMMLAGAAATGQCFNVGRSFPSLLPSDLDGATGAPGSTPLPPAGSPNFFLDFGANSLNLFKFHVDFANSANTTLTGPTTLVVPSFSQACNGGTCIPQAGTATTLDSLGDRLMYRLAYRNFGANESLVVTHSVTGGGTSATRWYELRSPGSGTFSLYQASSYAPDATYRWMGSVAMDKFGNLAIGYSASSTTIFPAIRYTGRTAGDPLNTLRQEVELFAGAGSQTGTLSRWGDYSSMSLDPADDCTFWYTTEYLKSSGSFNWSTRIGSFRFSGCGAPPTPDFSLSATPSSQTVVQGNSTTYTVTTTATNGFSGGITLNVSGLPSGASGSFSPNPVAAGGSSTLTVSTATTTPTGSYPLTITGTSGTLTHSTSVTLVVSGPPDFSLSASPASQSVVQGASTSYSVTITPSGGFNGSVTLSVSGLPSGATGTFSPNPATTSSTLSVATSATTPTGSYPLTITGVSGTLTHTTSVTLVVTRPRRHSS